MAEEKATALLQVEQGVGESLALDHRHQCTVIALGDVALHARCVVLEDVIHEPGTGRRRQVLGTKSDQPAGRNAVVQPDATLAVRQHIEEFAFAVGKTGHDCALVCFVEVDRQLLPGLVLDTVNIVHDDFRARYGQFEVFPAHVFYEHRQMQLTAP